MENSINHLIKVPAKELLAKCKWREDIVNISRELGKFELYNNFI